MLSKLYRKFIKLIDKLRSTLTIIHLRMMFPSLSIDFNSYVAKDCHIKCTDQSKMIIKNTVISRGSTIMCGHGGHLTISDTFIGINAVITCRYKLSIESGCQIAEMVTIRDSNHDLVDLAKFNSHAVIIEPNVWIGAKTTVVAGTRINQGVIIGANSVARGLLETGFVYAGVPVKQIKSIS